MKRSSLLASALVAGSLFASGGAMARSDRSDGDSRFPRGSQAWFTHESLEHGLRLLGAGVDVADASVQIVTPTSSTVTVALVDGSSVVINCLMVDEWSRHGTILKKEVRCTRL